MTRGPTTARKTKVIWRKRGNQSATRTGTKYEKDNGNAAGSRGIGRERFCPLEEEGKVRIAKEGEWGHNLRVKKCQFYVLERGGDLLVARAATLMRAGGELAKKGRVKISPLGQVGARKNGHRKRLLDREKKRGIAAREAQQNT